QEAEMCASERAAAERYSTDGANSFAIGNRNVATAGFLIYSHLRDKGDAHSRPHHSQQARKLTAFEDDLRVNASAIARCDGIFAKAMTVTKKEERFFADILKRNGLATGKFVLLWQNGEKRLCEQRRRFEFVTANRQSQDGNVHNTGPETVEKNGGDLLNDG